MPLKNMRSVVPYPKLHGESESAIKNIGHRDSFRDPEKPGPIRTGISGHKSGNFDF